jgi:hypothetical protein
MGSALKFFTCYTQEHQLLDSFATGDETWGFHHTPESSSTIMMCKKKSWHVVHRAGGRLSITQGYRSWLQDLINVSIMPATVLKNKVI